MVGTVVNGRAGAIWEISLQRIGGSGLARD